MSLYGALFSGVSGMNAQSSAMGAISDNISNANTVGYKGTNTQFSTLVTQQVSQTRYSPGGVQASPRMGVDVQGLLQATNSSTDVAMSGKGFFVVNEVAKPNATGDQFGYTRAGSFKVDQEGYLMNTSGWYLQGWPLTTWDGTPQASTVQIGNNIYMKSYKDPAGEQIYINDNVVSGTHLQPLNLNEIGGIAEQTRNIRMGANLPNTAKVGETITQPIRVYDSLGGESPMQILWSKNAQNRWKMEAYPPLGTRSLALKDSKGGTYGTMGRLDLTAMPQPFQPDNGAAGAAHIPQRGQVEMSFGNNNYIFRTGTALYDANNRQLFVEEPPGTNTYIPAEGWDGMAPDSPTDAQGRQLVANVGGVWTNSANAVFSNATPPVDITATVTGMFFTKADMVGLKLGDFMSNLATDVNEAFNQRYNAIGTDLTPAAGNVLSLMINGETPALNWTMPATVNSATSAMNFLNQDADFIKAGLKATVNDGRLFISSPASKTITVTDASTGGFATNGWGRYDGTGTWNLIDPPSIVTSGIKYGEKMQDADGSGSSGLVFRQTDNNPNIGSITITGLDSLVKANGTKAAMQALDPTNSNGFTVGNLNHAADPLLGDNVDDAIYFNEDGTPRAINVSTIDIDWANGSQDMTGTNAINIFLGNLNVRDGMTQAGDQYVLNYWKQDGTRFGNFSGVSVGKDGIVTALFDNGVVRPVFQIPVATFVNYNGLQSVSGNVFLGTDQSGDPTLRAAASAGAGSMAASSLEASTVDIATEFTNMIVTQRAYSAASKTVVTSDEMLNELINIKR